MLETFLIVFAVTALIFRALFTPNNKPPGPTYIPLASEWSVFNQTEPQKYFDELFARFGPYCALPLSRFSVVVVSGWEAVNEALLNPSLLGRPDVCLVRDRFQGENYGILFTEGVQWEKQRRFCLEHFRRLGFGRRQHEAVIEREAQALVEAIKAKGETPFPVEGLIGAANINITWRFIGGRRFDYGDPLVRFLDRKIKQCMHQIKMFGSIAVALPCLRFVFPEWTGYSSVKGGTAGLLNFIQTTIEEHRNQIGIDEEMDLIHMYLQRLAQNNQEDATFSENQLAGLCLDLLCAGADTSTAVVSFAVLFLCVRPDLQERAFAEIRHHVEPDKIPSSSDRPNLVYTEAILSEVLRIRTPAPNTIPHKALTDTTLGGYFISKGTIVILNMNSILMDKDYWKDPEVFRPERFICEDRKFIRHERLIPFGRGKRKCLGESLAKLTTFTLLATLIQNFEFRFKEKGESICTKGVPGFTLVPPSYDVIARRRNVKDDQPSPSKHNK